VIGTEFEQYFLHTYIDFTKPDKFSRLYYYTNDPFYTNCAIYDLFFKIQQLNHAVYKLKNAYRFKKANIYNTEDLYMNPISPKDKNVIVLLQNNTRYVFHIRELIQSINNSLSNCNYFFSNPLECKNPYTNMPFSKSALYNIYFAIRESTYLMPILLHKYFLTNFSYSNFSKHNEEMINDEYLKTYVENHCLENVHEQVREMFDFHDIKCYIHRRFPKDLLYNIMKPYLQLYFVSNFSMNMQRKRQAYRMLTIKLKAFIKYNPNFGKQKVKLYSDNPFKKIKKCKYYFDEAVIPFVDYFEKVNDVRIFTTSHLAEVKNRTTHQIEPISLFEQLNTTDNVHEDSSEDNNEESINTNGDDSNHSHTSSPSIELSEEGKEDEENEDNYNENDEDDIEESNNLIVIRSESISSFEYEWEEQDTDSISLD
jgi:hypothetical protein